ncbi:copper homeostasis membrane protein CopD [Bradyrhizobium sp. AZCC 1693]|uniref:copper homeostasis membrane protein CopD n=1 Tax=Bradyrhizobium sp. AZCC 1693 TaxID=3117029 RepID=UPI002FF0FC16
MSWFAADIDGPLVLTRAIHVAASATLAGGLIFRGFVAEPALQPSPEAYAVIQPRIAELTWAGLVVAAATGAVWFVLETMSMTGLGGGEAMRSGAMLTVANETQFGMVSEVRATLTAVLAACLLFNRFVQLRWLAVVIALGLIAAIAWTGHAGSTLGELGNLHLAADVLHLCAASAWIGGLVGLSILFAIGRRRPALEWEPLQLHAVRRFSTLGIISVATLIASGIVNAWILVGSFRGLLVTDYGQMLLLKIAVFAIMVAFATVNRLLLTPRLALAAKGEMDRRALAALTRNTLIEIALGLVIFAIVGVLGTMHPAIHLVK